MGQSAHEKRFFETLTERAPYGGADNREPAADMALAHRRTGSGKVHIEVDDAGRDGLCGVGGLEVTVEAVRLSELCPKCLRAWARRREAEKPGHPTDAQMVEAARVQHHREGGLEIDDKAKVSRADDNEAKGAYVQAWVWVPDEDGALMVVDEKAGV